MDKHLHIISFDIPYPANYGGVIDVFYRIKHLHKLGVKIILHCFQYGDRKPAAILENYCEKVYYYPRKTGLAGIHATLPYIVSSRVSATLLKNVQTNDAPILFEGTHTCYFASHQALSHRKKILRAHNLESAYYYALSKNTSHFLKRIYYILEAKRLQRYERNLQYFNAIACVSPQDFTMYQRLYPQTNIQLIPSSHANDEVVSCEGMGTYCLYHGNLEVEENIRAVEYLIEHIFQSTTIPLIVAGKNPSANLLSKANNHITFVTNPSDEKLNELMQHAHIHVLPTFQDTGLKLKLVYALFTGRHCVVNTSALDSSLLSTVHIAETNEHFIEKINTLMSIPFTLDDIAKRKKALLPFSNSVNAQAFFDLI